MSFSDTRVQLIEVMNSKRSSPRTKQRPSSEPSSPDGASQPSQSPSSKMGRHPKADSSRTSAPQANKARRIHGHEADWRQWDYLAEQLGFSDHNQAEVLHYLLSLTASPTLQSPLPSSNLGAEAIKMGDTPPETDLLTQTAILANQMLGIMTTLTLHFQQQQQQHTQLNQLLVQVLQALTVGLATDTGVRTVGVRTGTVTPKDSFAVLDSQDLKKSHAKGSAEEKLRRAFQAIVAHNESVERSHTDKWAINQNALAELTGCNRPAIKQFLKQYGADIETHHQMHGLMPRHNYAHGKVGTKITDIIHW